MRTLARSPERRYATALGALALVGWLILATPASAAPTCGFDPMTAIVTIGVGDGESAAIAVSGSSITLDGVACDVATVSTTDAIVVDGSAGIPAQITFDLTGGGLAPGLTPEADGGLSEIEMSLILPNGSPLVRVVGGPVSDNFVLGAGGINLNAVEATGDVDVTIGGSPLVVLDGNAGNDVLSVAGGAGAGVPAAGSLNGGSEGDLLLGGLGGSAIDGGDGPDTIDYSAATRLVSASLSSGVVTHAGGGQADQLSAIENLTGSPGDDAIVGDGGANVLRGGPAADTLVGGPGDDTIDGQAGVDTIDFTNAPIAVTINLAGRTAVGDGADTLSEIENAIGSSGNDLIVGDQNANVLSGIDGDDLIVGEAGDDTLDGGPGNDTLGFGQLETGVEVDLRDGTSTGEGNDTLSGFENVVGTNHADTIHADDGSNLIVGGPGSDEIFGHDGSDGLLGSQGNDQLFGQRGGDLVRGGPGRDQLDGGQGQDTCRGGPDPDAFVFCETIRL